MMFYDVIYERSHSRGMNMHMLPAKAMRPVHITTAKKVGSNGFLIYKNVLEVI